MLELLYDSKYYLLGKDSFNDGLALSVLAETYKSLRKMLYLCCFTSEF
jgi:hypothetical protein